MPAHMRVLAKPAKGEAKADRRKRRRAIETAETLAKRQAKERDEHTCRRCGLWAGALVPLYGALVRVVVEAAHLINKGMGGDGGRFSWMPKHFVTLCHDCHQGPRSVYSGHLRMEFDAQAMGDGVVRFVDAEPGKGAR